MDALVYRGPQALALEQRQTPEPAPGEVLVRVQACGICGTDLRIAAGTHRAYPDGTVRVPGHEIAGVVEAVGDGAPLACGDRVFVAPNVGCGTCDQCLAGRVNLCRTPQALGITRDGGLATHLLAAADVVAQGNLLPVPADADAAAVAVVEPLACVLRGQRPCRISAGDRVLIVGAGPIGLLHLLAARAREPGEIVVSEPSAARRRRAAEQGADRVVEPGELSGAFDVVIVAAPAAAAQAAALELAAPGGRVNFFAGLPRDGSRVELDTNLVHYKELVVTGTTACTTEDCREALELVLSGAVDAGRLVTARRPLADVADAFAAARSGEQLKVVVEP
jgi:2-desacetyl-2-hydroxyethyl bacteriochlorophyllide A dehydrogenase